jgi:GNAT superfamily N-acetyltransferase
LSSQIVAYTSNYEPELLVLSMRAWSPVFEKLKPAVPSYVYRAFYPQDWRVRQAVDIRAFLEAESQHAWIALEEGVVLGWVGIRLHPQDRMGKIYILAVDPDQQRRGVASALIGHAMVVMRQAGLEIVMVETGDDPGHAASRATYEHEGFQRWPVARYFREL